MVGSISSKILFDHANIESKSHNQHVPLLIAMKHAQYEFATFLVKKGANVTHIYVMQGFITALHCVGNCRTCRAFDKERYRYKILMCSYGHVICVEWIAYYWTYRVFFGMVLYLIHNDLEVTHAKQDNLHRSRNIVRLLLCCVTFKNRSLQALDPAFVKNLRGFIILAALFHRLVPYSSSSRSSFSSRTLHSNRLPGVAFRLFRNIRSFVTFHGLFMADGFEFTGSSLSGRYDFSDIHEDLRFFFVKSSIMRVARTIILRRVKLFIS